MPKSYKKTDCGKNARLSPYACFKKGVGVGLYVLAPKKAKEAEEAKKKKKKTKKILKKWSTLTTKLISKKKVPTLTELNKMNKTQLIAVAKRLKIPYTKKSAKGYKAPTTRLTIPELKRAILGMKPKKSPARKPKLKVKISFR